MDLQEHRSNSSFVRERINNTMDILISILVCVLIGYCFGCFSTAYFVGKLHGIDIRNEGSGNLGSTNALRTLGAKAGLMTFAGDILKTVIPISIFRIVYHGQGDFVLVLAMWMGLGVVLGHNFPFWLHFKGGKGIAVTAAVILVTAEWPIMVAGILIFAVIVGITRYVSLGSLVASFYLFANVLIFHRDSPEFVQLVAVSLVFAAMAFFQHRGNIVRLINGTERKVGAKKE